MAHPSWAEGLSVAGLYYDGVVDETRLQEVLELHKRDTVSTFGTRCSRRVSKTVNTTNTGKESASTLSHSSLQSEKENSNSIDRINESSQEKLKVNANTSI